MRIALGKRWQDVYQLVYVRTLHDQHLITQRAELTAPRSRMLASRLPLNQRIITCNAQMFFLFTASSLSALLLLLEIG